MATTVYNLNGYPNGTDIGSVTGITRAFGSAGELVVNADGQMDVTTGNQTLATMNAGAATHEIHTKLGSGGGATSNMLCAVRVTDVNNMYCSRYTGGNAELWQRVGGTFTNLGTVAASFSAGDSMGLKWDDATGKLTVYKNGVAITGLIDITPSNSLSASNTVGFHGRSQGATDLVTEFTVTGAAAQTITDINGGEPIVYGSTGNIATITGYTLAPNVCTVDGITQTITAATTSSATFNLAGFVDGETRSDPTANQDVVLTRGSETATLSHPVALPTGWDTETVASAVTDNDKYLFYTGYGVDSTNGNKLFFDTEGQTLGTDNFHINPDGRILVHPDYVGTKTVWLWIAATGEMVEITVPVSEAGVDNRGLTAVGLTSAGLTAIGLTAVGL